MENNVKCESYCRFNDGVDCNDFKCWNCGWNPVVATKRINEIKVKRQEELMENQ